MSSSIELLSLNELNIRRINLMKLLKNTDREIEKKKKEQLDVSKSVSEENIEESIIDSMESESCKKLPKKQIKIKINISKSNK